MPHLENIPLEDGPGVPNSALVILPAAWFCSNVLERTYRLRYVTFPSEISNLKCEMWSCWENSQTRNGKCHQQITMWVVSYKSCFHVNQVKCIEAYLCNSPAASKAWLYSCSPTLVRPGPLQMSCPFSHSGSVPGKTRVHQGRREVERGRMLDSKWKELCCWSWYSCVCISLWVSVMWGDAHAVYPNSLVIWR